MKITLVLTNTRGKSMVFISDSLKVLSLSEALNVVEKGELQNIYSVNSKFGTYLRSTPNKSEKDNLDMLSVSVSEIIKYVNGIKNTQDTNAINVYVTQYITSISEQGGSFIETVDRDKAFTASVKNKISKYMDIITQAAKEFSIDQYLLGAILIDEIVRMDPFETLLDAFLINLLGRNVSVGLAQVKLETANNLIKKSLYNPNPKDGKLPFFGTLSNKNRRHLYQYVIQPKHNIRFAAAYMRDVIDFWSSKIDLVKYPEIVATLYSKGYGDPKFNPEPSKRGDQIATEFYKLAQKWIE